MLKEEALAKSMRSPETPISFDNLMGGVLTIIGVSRLTFPI